MLDRPFDPRRRSLPEDAARALSRIDAVLVAPIGSRGFVALAPKLSGGEFDVEDIDFLRSAADQIGIGVDRIRMQVEEEDYAQARAIQQTLLPREMPQIERLELSGVWQPARTMGGDYYDLLKLSDAPFDVEDIDFLRSVADQLDIGVDRIRQQREEVDYEQARTIQQSLLPREMPRVAGVELSGIWQPARTMGGDYYDLLKLSETELAVCIGDVAGKGMPAALLMSGLQAAVRASASGSPRDLCERVRRVVVSSLSGGRFVTFFYATIDTAAMRLRWCNAGHNAPILARADGTMVRLTEGGPAFTRLFRESGYEEREVALMPGDRLVLFTDGVSEASGGDGEMFGEPRIEQLVATNRNLGALELQQTIAGAATAFSGGELDDDLTLVVAALI
jgi:serine phosphatase RsbU (regulator of sigma subunit)